MSKLDRLRRSMSDLAHVLDVMRAQGLALITLDMPVDMTTPGGEALASMMAVFARWQRRTISGRTREGLAAARARGTKLGAQVAVPDDVAQRIVRLRAEGAILTGIADVLNDERVLTSRGGSRWWPSTVRAVLARSA